MGIMKCVIAAALLCVLILPDTAESAMVIIDPGHGGRDPGAVSEEGLKETDVVWDISIKLKKILEARGYDTALTRTDKNKRMSLQARTEFKNGQKADIFVSVHANHHRDSRIDGTLVLYYDNRYPQFLYPASPAMAKLTPESRRLAINILEAIVRKAGTTSRGLMASSAYVVRHGSIPSVLVETAFLSNRKDAQKLARASFREKIAQGIADGIEQYIPAGAFRDVVGHWSGNAVRQLKNKGLVSGRTAHEYYPDAPLTRAEFMAMLDRLFHFAEPVRYPDRNYGVSDQHWAWSILLSAASKGFIEGYPDGTLRPDRFLTRAEAAVLMARVAGIGAERVPGTSPFRDVSRDEWFAPAVYSMYAKGILRGAKQGMFQPARPMTRGEMAVMVERYLRSN